MKKCNNVKIEKYNSTFASSLQAKRAKLERRGVKGVKGIFKEKD